MPPRIARLLLAVVAASCARPPIEPSPPPPLPSSPTLAPAARLPHASLFHTDVIGLPTGTTLTPDAAPGSTLFSLDPHVPAAPSLRASSAVNVVLSPDGRTLLVLTSGYNLWYGADGKRVPAASSQWVFVYDVANGMPREIDAVAVPNTFGGIAFGADGRRFYVSGGPDDLVREYAPDPSGKYVETLPSIPLGHLAAHLGGGLGLDEGPFAAGVALTPSGTRLLVANHQNDSVSVLDLSQRRVAAEIPLRPGGGIAGGEFPFGLLALDEHRAVVTSQRDREVDVLDLDAGSVTKRIKVGSSPTTLTRNRRGNRLYVTNANSDSVSVVDVDAGTVLSEIGLSAPPGGTGAAKRPLTGASPNSAALSPDEQTLYVTLGGNNAVALVDLSPRDRGEPTGDASVSRLAHLVPTGFYPHAVTTSRDGRFFYVAYGKSPTGPNTGGPYTDPKLPSRSMGFPGARNEYALQLQHGGLHAFPVPGGAALPALTTQTLINNRFLQAPEVSAVLAGLRGVVKHVIYVVAENRSYDQVLGDLAIADGDARLVHWPARITPNQHALASTFVALDRFFDSGGVSGDGWQWTMMGRSTDFGEKAIPLEYAGRGNHSYDWEGMSRNVNVASPSVAQRRAWNPATPDSDDLLPGTTAVGGVDEPDEGGPGLLWDAALAAGRSVRNYGCFLDPSRYGLPPNDRGYLPMVPMPYESKLQVAFPTRPSLVGVTDPYYWGFEMALADFWREREWAREFAGFVAKRELPALEVVRLPHDHLGSFAGAKDGVDTPDTQMADHDYALGLMVERLSRSPFWSDTVLIALEDDAQNGSDHVDAHRSLLYVAGGHVRRGAVVSSVYTTPSVLRTIEVLLGLAPLGQPDAFAPAMGDVFSATASARPFTAIVPSVLRSTALPLPEASTRTAVDEPRGNAAMWAKATASYDFTRADAVPTEDFNRLLYCQLVATTKCGE